MPRSDRFEIERLTTIRFHMDATVDQVTARLLEAVRRTDLSLLTLWGDEDSVYPFRAVHATEAASSWRAELLWREDASDMGSHLEVFLGRAEVFLNCRDGVHVEAKTPPRKASPGSAQNRGAYGLDGGFGRDPIFVQDEPA